MKLKELPGWVEALEGARQVFTNVPEEAFTEAGEQEAPPEKTFICSSNEVYVAACETGRVRLKNGQRADVYPRAKKSR